MSLTSHEEAETERYLTPMSEYEGLFSDQPRIPREHPTLLPKQPVSFSHYQNLHRTVQKNAPTKNNLAVNHAAVLAEGYIPLDGMPTTDLLTMERAVLDHGQAVAEKLHMPQELVDTTENQLDGLLDNDQPRRVISPLALSVTVLSLVRMEEVEHDPARQNAVSKAFESIPSGPEELELLRRQALIGHDTGELVVQAILEHEPVSA